MAKADAASAKKANKAAKKAKTAPQAKPSKPPKAAKQAKPAKKTKKTKKTAQGNGPSPSGVIALVVVLLAAALAAGWFFILRDTSTSEPVVAPVAAVPFSFPDALANAQSAQAMQVDVNATIAGVDSTITAQVDRSSRLMSVTASTAQLGDLDLPEWINVIVDSDNRLAYIESSALSSIAPTVTAEWVRIDLDDAALANVIDVGPMTINPLDVADLLTGVDATDLGRETVNGEQLHHFQVPVDASQIRLGSPASMIPLDVWISTDNQIRRVGYASGATTFDMTLLVFDRSLTITVPQPADTVDLSEITGG